MLDLLLIAALGFVGSFGHCVGMCGPITAAFSLSQGDESKPSWVRQLYFHGLLNVGRIVSYALVGVGIGALGSVLVAGGQMAGIGSDLRRLMAIITGILLIWFGLAQISPTLLPHLPIAHPLAQGRLHHRLSQLMLKLSLRSHWWTPALLGLVWGLVPCGFLYAAQIKAAETSNPWWGGATMLAFGLGTAPTLLGVGVFTGLMSRDRRSQLFRLGGWITLLIGILTLLRTGDTMTDYTGHGALLCLVLALIARPISRFWAHPLHYRRVLGVGAFVLSLVHTLHMLEHSWGWNLDAFTFMLPQHQWGIIAGAIALICMTPAACTSFDGAQKRLGRLWRSLHLLAVPALVLAVTHCILIGSHYLGQLQLSWVNYLCTGLLIGVVLIVFIVRSRVRYRQPTLMPSQAQSEENRCHWINRRSKSPQLRFDEGIMMLSHYSRGVYNPLDEDNC
ncbi:MAG: sulfite exporter TauE/SafE family protein [Oculatellaceae cyanobacterium bins.114]|nr:sulfite exporter TauE/SafE family protein [Oculatellaceae cyanobacterium bins.114]